MADFNEPEQTPESTPTTASNRQLDSSGLSYFWSKVKSNVSSQLETKLDKIHASTHEFDGTDPLTPDMIGLENGMVYKKEEQIEYDPNLIEFYTIISPNYNDVFQGPDNCLYALNKNRDSIIKSRNGIDWEVIHQFERSRLTLLEMKCPSYKQTHYFIINRSSEMHDTSTNRYVYHTTDFLSYNIVYTSGIFINQIFCDDEYIYGFNVEENVTNMVSPSNNNVQLLAPDRPELSTNVVRFNEDTLAFEDSGLNYTDVPSGLFKGNSSNCSSILYVNGYYFAICYSNVSSPSLMDIYYSSMGFTLGKSTWESFTLPNVTNLYYFIDIIYAFDKYIFIDAKKGIYCNSNLDDFHNGWVLTYETKTPYYMACYYDENAIYIIDGNDCIAYSYDGVIWYKNDYSFISYTGCLYKFKNLFITCDGMYDHYYFSTDGLNYTRSYKTIEDLSGNDITEDVKALLPKPEVISNDEIDAILNAE